MSTRWVASLAAVLMGAVSVSGAGVVRTPGRTRGPAAAPVVAERGVGTVTLIHIGDIHGHLVPRPNVRDPDPTATEGGLARMFTVIERIRRRRGPATLLLNTGDAVQGSAEALFTRGEAVTRVLNLFRIDAFAPGNWDYLYGTERFRELFVGKPNAPPLAPWNAIAANLYDSTRQSDTASAAPGSDSRVLPPYTVRTVGGVRVGILGFTTQRGPRAVGLDATRGFSFTSGDEELGTFVARLREVEHVDVIVMLSELELANNIRLAEAYPGVDVILSADMHERTTRPIVVGGTVIVEEGQDGTVVGELTLRVADGRLTSWTWQQHVVGSDIPEASMIARAVAEVRRPFLTGPGFVSGQVNPINGATLDRPIDEVVGATRVDLHRANLAHERMPAVLEGSSHDFLTDAIRAATGADVAALRGFRFGTHVRAGPITRADLYHLLPIGAQVARVAPVYGPDLKNQIEMSLRGTFDADPRQWTGGWLFAFSGLTLDVDIFRPYGERALNVHVGDSPLDRTGATAYSVAGLWYESEPETVNNCGVCLKPSARVSVLREADGRPLDAVEVVVRYLASLPGRVADPALHRVRPARPLPAAILGVQALQPLRGAGAVAMGAPGDTGRRAAGQGSRPPRD